MSESSETLSEKRIKIAGNVNGWGSCQYATAYQMCVALQTMEKKLGSPEASLAYFGIKIDGPLEPITASVDGIVQLLIKRIQDDIVKFNYTGEDRAIQEENINQLIKTPPKTFDEVLTRMRNHAHDLWFTVPYVFKYAFPTTAVNVTASEGFGPPCNRCVQSSNHAVGLEAWLLLRSGLVRDIGSFDHFDT